MSTTVLNKTAVTGTVVSEWYRSEPAVGIGAELVADGTLVGDWKIETSISPLAIPGTLAAGTKDDPSNVTTDFSPSIAHVAGDGGVTAQQVVFVEGKRTAAYRFTFTYSSGAGDVRVHVRT